MQPVQTQQGLPAQSQLLDSLRVYLSNKKRLQPIIGLGSIIECVRAGSHDRKVLYLCEVCVCRFGKADIRTHIMGSLHRYNYIAVWHPDLVPEWEEMCDLSKLAWPLMEMARTIEEKEGHGDVQFLEIEDAAYKALEAFSETEAQTLIHTLISGHAQGPDNHSEDATVQLEPIQSQRSVVLSCNHQERTDSLSKSMLEETGSQSPEEPVLAESSSSSSSFLDGCAGAEPLIGLSYLVECRSEDGRTYCFLCHCCRIRTNKEDIIDHLNSSSHLRNYLMERCPEQVEVVTADVDEDYQLLQSLAIRAEQEEGRPELEVVNAPESLCVHLTSKSYHWCITMLCKSWSNTKEREILKRKISKEGLDVSRDAPEHGALVTLTKMRKRSDSVFKVSLPASKGSVLLHRMSGCVVSLPVSPSYSPAPDSDLTPSSGSWSEEDGLDCDTTLGQETNITVSIYQDEAAYLRDMEYLKSSGHLPGTEDTNLYAESNDTVTWDYEEGLSEGFSEEWQNKFPQTQTEGLLPSEYNYQNWEVEGWY